MSHQSIGKDAAEDFIIDMTSAEIAEANDLFGVLDIIEVNAFASTSVHLTLAANIF